MLTTTNGPFQFPLIRFKIPHTISFNNNLQSLTAMETTIATPAPTPSVQHITKASSDQLLSKFAELDSPRSNKSLRLFKRQKRSAQSTSPVTRRESSEFATGERKSLLLPAARRSSGATALVRQLKVGRSHIRSKSFKKRSILATIEKTWKRTLDGASKVFMEKQYNRHKRLLSDTI